MTIVMGVANQKEQAIHIIELLLNQFVVDENYWKFINLLIIKHTLLLL